MLQKPKCISVFIKLNFDKVIITESRLFSIPPSIEVKIDVSLKITEPCQMKANAAKTTLATVLAAAIVKPADAGVNARAKRRC